MHNADKGSRLRRFFAELSRRKLIALERGGSAERPIEVDSASVIEARAESISCPDCTQSLRTVEHQSVEHAGELLRAVELVCRGCGAQLRLYFRIWVRILCCEMKLRDFDRLRGLSARRGG